MLSGSSVDFSVQSTMDSGRESVSDPGAAIFMEGWRRTGMSAVPVFRKRRDLSGFGLGNWVLNSCLILKNVGLIFSEEVRYLHQCLFLLMI